MNYHIWTVSKHDYKLMLRLGGVIRRKYCAGAAVPEVGDRVKFNNFSEIFEVTEVQIWEGCDFVEAEVRVELEQNILGSPLAALALSDPLGKNQFEKETNFLKDAGAVWDLYSRVRTPGDDRFAQYWSERIPSYVKRIETGRSMRPDHDIFYVKSPVSDEGKNEILAIAAVSRIKRYSGKCSWVIRPNITFIFGKTHNQREEIMINWAAEAIFRRFINWAIPDLRDNPQCSIEVCTMTNRDLGYLEGCMQLLIPKKMWHRIRFIYKHHS